MSGAPIGIVDTDVGPLFAPIDPWIWPSLVETGSWEPLVGNVVRSILSMGDTVVNVGAHVGYYTRMAAIAIGGSGLVYAYEPAPSNRKLLRMNTSDLPAVVIRHTAVSNYTGSSTLALSTDNPGDHRLDAHPDSTTSIPVDVVMLDSEIFPRPPRLILTDAQGCDLRILRGARRLIDKERPHLLIEWTPSMLDHDDYPEIDRLIANGYTARIVEADRFIESATEGDVIADGTGTLHLDPGE
jgi:FkbM family methyltransferase